MAYPERTERDNAIGRLGGAGIYDKPYATDQPVSRKPTAAEYTEKRLAEAEQMLQGEVSRIAGQYDRLRQHFGIPPEPTNASAAPKDDISTGGMEYQVNRIHLRIQDIMELVSKMNELI